MSETKKKKKKGEQEEEGREGVKGDTMALTSWTGSTPLSLTCSITRPRASPDQMGKFKKKKVAYLEQQRIVRQSACYLASVASIRPQAKSTRQSPSPHRPPQVLLGETLPPPLELPTSRSPR